MENQLELLYNKISEKMTAQTIEITDLVTRSVMKTLEEKLIEILEENKHLKSKVNILEKKVEFLEEEKRKNNLILFGVKESEWNGSLIEDIKIIIEKETNINIQPHEINKAYRIGIKGKYARPLLVSFTSTWKRNLILRCKNKFTPGFYIKEDFSKAILEERKKLIPLLIQEREKGKIAYLKKDKLIVKDKMDSNDAKRKRDQVDSPNKSPTQLDTSAPKKVNKTNNLNNFIARSRPTPFIDSKNQQKP